MVELPIDREIDLVTDVLKLIALKLEDVETVLFADGEFVEIEQIRALLSAVKDDILDKIEYQNPAEAEKGLNPCTPQLGDPDYEPADEFEPDFPRSSN